MAKLVWDAAGNHWYELGIDHGVLFPMKNDGTYDNGVVWDGLTGVTESPDGAEPNDMYADNIKYASIRSAETFGFTIEAYQSPDKFDECDGSAKPADGVSIGQQARRSFGFVYRTKIGNDTNSESDDGYKLHLVYGASASPSERAYETVNDSPEGITFSWECTTNPVSVEGYRPISTIVINSLKADSTKLATLEGQLFGGENTEATLPTPKAVINMFAPGTIP